MNRRELLKKTCSFGLCSCAGLALLENCESSEDTNTSVEPAWRLKWWLEHCRSQNARLWELLADYLDEADQIAILEQLGRNCAANLGWARQYKGDPEGFFQRMNQHNGEVFDYDKDAGVITITTRQRDCDCLLVNSKNISPIYCACSVGWQKHTYETILGKKVDVEVKESVLRGSKRCVFVVTIQKEENESIA